MIALWGLNLDVKCPNLRIKYPLVKLQMFQPYEGRLRSCVNHIDGSVHIEMAIMHWHGREVLLEGKAQYGCSPLTD